MHLLAKYGVEFTFEAPVVKKDDTDLAATGDWTPASGDVKVSKDGGNVANVGTLPAAVGGTGSVLWTWTLSATEMQAARVTIQVVDAALEDQVLIVQTYGNASAQHAVDLDDAVRGGMTALPNAVADAAGGLVVSDAGGLDADAMATSVAAIEVDTDELQGDWVNGGRLDLLLDAVKAVTDLLTNAAKLDASAGQIILGTVDTVTNTHTPTTTEFQADDITEATADHYNGRIVIFTSGALAGQATDITDYAAVGGIGQFTVTALTEAPSNNMTFIIV